MLVPDKEGKFNNCSSPCPFWKRCVSVCCAPACLPARLPVFGFNFVLKVYGDPILLVRFIHFS